MGQPDDGRGTVPGIMARVCIAFLGVLSPGIEDE